MATINHPQEQVLEEEELLLLQETAAMNASSSFFNEPAAATECFTHLHLNNRHQPPCTSCGSHKRPSSENPVTHLQPNPKKPNTTITTTHSLFGFSKIPLSPPPLLRRCSSDPYIPPLPPVVEEPPVLPRPNAEPECPGTRLSNAIASNKLPPRSPTLRRSVSELFPSPEKTVSGSSSDSPHAEWVRKMRDCMRNMSRKWGELLGDEKDISNEEINNDNSSRGVNNGSNNDAKLENYEGGHVEVVSVEKKGDALILHFKCPCGSGYQILLLGGNCYYKLM
ncbi:hypothetical protein KPL71_027024 [Citrus sinensis]|uniref:Uncharacterized protein n=1 Tax=Citrus sinensis TaxID=2711 RepID=A0ACB8I3E7_CITSI|nr:hypothetical protein KPL71_027024 [Citrus sinensis]